MVGTDGLLVVPVADDVVSLQEDGESWAARSSGWVVDSFDGNLELDPGVRR